MHLIHGEQYIVQVRLCRRRRSHGHIQPVPVFTCSACTYPFLIQNSKQCLFAFGRRRKGCFGAREQESSYGESVSTLAFGARVSEITLGAARKHCESGALFDAREAAGRQVTLLRAGMSWLRV